METIIVELEDQEYITLVNLLKITGVIGTGGIIKALLDEEAIMYNDTIAFQKRKKCYSGDVITINDETRIEVK